MGYGEWLLKEEELAGWRYSRAKSACPHSLLKHKLKSSPLIRSFPHPTIRCKSDLPRDSIRVESLPAAASLVLPSHIPSVNNTNPNSIPPPKNHHPPHTQRNGQLRKQPHSPPLTHLTTNIHIPQPIPTPRLRQICNDACTSAISTTTLYDHSSTQAWNNTIINTILKSLISECPSESKYKFIVNTTIIQHLSDPRGGEDSTMENKKVGRRGMHSASGAFWNNEKDGMWSYKFEGGEGKGMDIVVSVMWVAV